MERELAGLGFDSWPALIGLLGAGVAIVGWVMGRENKVLASKGAGIVTFELARDAAEGKSIIEAWGTDGRRAAMRSLLIDFLFIVLYVSAVGIACLYVAAVSEDLSWHTFRILGKLFAAGTVAAGVFDGVENVALMLELSGEPTEARVQIARSSALVKFALIGASLAYAGAVRSLAWLFGG